MNSRILFKYVQSFSNWCHGEWMVLWGMNESSAEWRKPVKWYKEALLIMYLGVVYRSNLFDSVEVVFFFLRGKESILCIMRQIACYIIDCCLCPTNIFECLLLGRHCVRPSLLSTEQENVPAPMYLLVCWGQQTIHFSFNTCVYLQIDNMTEMRWEEKHILVWC